MADWTKEDWTGCSICTAVVLFVLLAVGLGLGLGVDWRATPKPTPGTETIIIVLPLVTPPVAGAAPTVFVININTQNAPRFKTLGKKFAVQAIDPQTVIDRFFNPDGGPSNLFGILKSVDEQIKGINPQLKTQFKVCMNTTATAYTLSTWGVNTTFYAQCSLGGTDSTEAAPLPFTQWAIKNKNYYLYNRGSEASVAAIIFNYNATGGPDLVHVWYSVGETNRNGSHGVVEILARPRTAIFEMTAAGGGLGFCGAQIKSDNTTLNITGSQDMGATCQSQETLCVSAQDIHTTKTCTAASNTFTLRAIGRMRYNVTSANGHKAVNGPSKYPHTPNVYLTGTGFDDTFFGPRVPTV
jgi:hypothetical protein